MGELDDRADAGTGEAVFKGGSVASSSGETRLIGKLSVEDQLRTIEGRYLQSANMCSQMLEFGECELIGLARERFLTIGREYDGSLFSMSLEELHLNLTEELADALTYGAEILRRRGVS